MLRLEHFPRRDVTAQPAGVVPGEPTDVARDVDPMPPLTGGRVQDRFEQSLRDQGRQQSVDVGPDPTWVHARGVGERVDGLGGGGTLGDEPDDLAGGGVQLVADVRSFVVEGACVVLQHRVDVRRHDEPCHGAMRFDRCTRADAIPERTGHEGTFVVTGDTRVVRSPGAR